MFLTIFTKAFAKEVYFLCTLCETDSFIAQCGTGQKIQIARFCTHAVAARIAVVVDAGADVVAGDRE